MSELEPELDGPRPEFLPIQYRDEQKKLARFKAYMELCKNPVDIDGVALCSVAHELSENDQVSDIGGASGRLLRRLYQKFGFKGKKTCIDPNPGQFPKGDQLVNDTASNIDYLVGHANNLPLEDGSQKLIFAMFMLYHVLEEKQTGAIEHIKQKLQPDGIMVAATSGGDNKVVHRQKFEEGAAEHFNVKKPPYMNDSFNTNQSKNMLPQHFKFVYFADYFDFMVVETNEDVEIYLASILSLHDQFEPEVDKSELEKYLRAQILDYRDECGGSFKDIVSRSVFISSDREITNLPPEFKPIEKS